MKQRIKIGKYKTVFVGRTFTIKHANAVLANGKKAVFERAVRVPSVLIFAFDNKKRLLLTREYRAYNKKYFWWLPAGRTGKNENPKVAAQRELMEEAGYKAKNLKLFHKTKSGQSVEHIYYLYVATNLVPAKIEADEGEDITVKPTPLSKAYKMVVKGKIESELIAFGICKLYWNRKKYLKEVK